MLRSAIFVAGVGTGGTITGVFSVIETAVARLAVEPAARRRSRLSGQKGPHPIRASAPVVPPVLSTRTLVDGSFAIGGEGGAAGRGAGRRLGRRLPVATLQSAPPARERREANRRSPTSANDI